MIMKLKTSTFGVIVGVLLGAVFVGIPAHAALKDSSLPPTKKIKRQTVQNLIKPETPKNRKTESVRFLGTISKKEVDNLTVSFIKNLKKIKKENKAVGGVSNSSELKVLISSPDNPNRSLKRRVEPLAVGDVVEVTGERAEEGTVVAQIIRKMNERTKGSLIRQ